MSRVVCVAGMHRSGTSLVASWLQACGLPMTASTFIPAGVGNERGHFEDRAFVDLHHRVIERCVSGSQGWIVGPEHEVKMRLDERWRARRLVRRRSAHAPIWGWKDPRSTLVLPDWHRIVPGLLTLGLWRPRDEVVRSLMERSRRASGTLMEISRREAERCWDAYTDALLEHHANRPEQTVVISISKLTRSSPWLLGMLQEHLDGALSPVPLSDQFAPGRTHFEGRPPSNTRERRLEAAGA